ncbi:MAG: Rrf2 family transcriptional regulator [Deltaproteobacteria bacterium]|nr:Rrf2 family transcriptional regulator [Deltaproteobacteria bacterium]
MFISREYDYAIRVVRALAGKGRLTVGQICEAEHIPQPYAYKILKKLERAGVLTGYRGMQGGYELVADLAAINLYSIYEAVEGRLHISECLREGYACPNDQGGRCCVRRVLRDIQEQFVNELKKNRLSDLV